MSPILSQVGLTVLCLCFLACGPPEQPQRQTPPDLPYSFPPNIPELTAEQLDEAQISGMAQELGLEEYDHLGTLYFRNSFGLVYTPGQVPVIYQHKEQYRREMSEYWLQPESPEAAR